MNTNSLNPILEHRKVFSDTILKSFGVEDNSDIEKARSGIYDDTPENRKLGRVGQKYGNEKKEAQKKNSSPYFEGDEAIKVAGVKAGDFLVDNETGKRKKVRSVVNSSGTPIIHTTDGDIYKVGEYKPAKNNIQKAEDDELNDETEFNKAFDNAIFGFYVDEFNKASKWSVGDIHPNGKWMMTEYAPGKMDWRAMKKPQASPAAPKKPDLKEVDEDIAALKQFKENNRKIAALVKEHNESTDPDKKEIFDTKFNTLQQANRKLSLRFMKYCTTATPFNLDSVETNIMSNRDALVGRSNIRKQMKVDNTKVKQVGDVGNGGEQKEIKYQQPFPKWIKPAISLENIDYNLKHLEIGRRKSGSWNRPVFTDYLKEMRQVRKQFEKYQRNVNT